MEELDLKELFNIFWTRKNYIILSMAIFIVIGVIYSYIFTTPKYQSKTAILLAKSNESSQTGGSTVTTTDITLNQKLVSTYSELIKSDAVLSEVISNLKINKTPETLRSSISVSARSDTEIIDIKVTDLDPDVAKVIANETASVFMTKIAKEFYNMNNVYIFDEAKSATMPYNINHIKDIMIFTFVGLIIAIIYALIANVLDTTVKSKEDIEKKLGISVLTTIPQCDFEITTKSAKGGRK